MGGIISSIFGGGDTAAPASPNTQVYQPIGTTAQDQNLNSLFNQNFSSLQGNNNPYTQLNPQAAQIFQSLFNSPSAGGYQQAAGTAGNSFAQTGASDINLMNLLAGGANTALGAGNNVLNTAMDPQNALYNQLLQKTNDTANVTNAQYGLTGQQAAGNTQQADTNFNIDWQNNELQRQLQGLQGYNQALNNAAGASSSANSLGTAGAQNTLLGGETPYATGQAIGGAQQNALGNYLQQLLGPYSTSQPLIQNLQNYLNTGVSASNYGQNAALQDYGAQQQQSANTGSAIGSILGFGNGNGGTIGSSLYNALPSLSSLGSSIGSLFGL